MENAFAEQVIPGTFIRVQAENLISAGGISWGNVGIVGTAANADGGDNVLGTTQILSSLDDARNIYAPSDAISAATTNLMRSLEILFRNGATTVFAHALAAGSSAGDFTTAIESSLIKENINILIVPELSTADALTVLGIVNTAETDGKDIIAVYGSDKETFADISGDVTANKRFIMVTPGIQAYESASDSMVTLPGNYTAAAMAGLLSSLPPHISATNKVLSNVTELEQKFSYGQLKTLLQANVCPLEDRQGIRVVRGLTTEGAAFSQITTRRIVDFAKAGVRQVSNPFIGRLNNIRVRKALQGAIDGFLTTMVVDEMLTEYSLEVKATRQDEIAGRCVVNVAMKPTFSIDFIRVTLALS
ncbi:phage tail sheath C-terminal domain-containing protein [Hahella ganghwensis]|uniref:phage tail sheath C-terminal domain-containing protein n=1 Tax=Hahella ganghwensis TaxID=286420 RepID=UPI000368B5EF|nr:phage tail sheath C-terminal domain-containing protein [Hahella ganghwensis]